MHISQRYYNVIITLLESITIIYPFHNVMITLCVCWDTVIKDTLRLLCGNDGQSATLGNYYILTLLSRMWSSFDINMIKCFQWFYRLQVNSSPTLHAEVHFVPDSVSTWSMRTPKTDSVWRVLVALAWSSRRLGRLVNSSPNRKSNWSTRRQITSH